MKVLVTGGSGFVGYRLCERLLEAGHTVDYTYLSHDCTLEGANGMKADVSIPSQLLALAGGRYEAIVHSAALANVDFCEKNPEEARRQNVGGTANALALAEKCGATFLYVSTSHVFPSSDRAYREEDATDPSRISGVYAKTKLEGEMLVKNSGVPFLITRIDQPYHWRKEWQKDNTATRTLRKLESGERITEVQDWLNCPTFVPSFSSLCVRLLGDGRAGIFHAAGPDYLSRLDWGREIAKAAGYPESRVEAISSSSLNLPVARPNVRLDSSKAYAVAGLENVGVAEGVRLMLAEKK